eukprot:TRINITY_DN370_c0_g1_i1.p1 TRINITY_DN370_c0_g1~~TRINITY_DN370_c0_g1_i1.p1  ORF type:complete len:381 (-),score=98.77 TRINITY_DN370_c0_g1_i1:1024-2166(-)
MDLKKEKIETEGKKGQKKKKTKKCFNWDGCEFVKIALQVMYRGLEYHGFTSHGTQSVNTVEEELFAALRKTLLIRSDGSANVSTEVYKQCDYSRCARTDKGVSSMGQIISLRVRDIRPKGGNYASILNALLPDSIRVLRWAVVSDSFHARYDCSSREYRYYFLGNGLDVDKMQSAAQQFVGEHDFRNFCRMDVPAVTDFQRTIYSFDVVPFACLTLLDESIEGEKKDLCYFQIRGSAFLYHQVRCMVAVLFMIGAGDEEIDIISKLLDLEHYPRKPQYVMASFQPLVLQECTFSEIHWEDSGEIGSHAYRMMQSPLFDVCLWNGFPSFCGKYVASTEDDGKLTHSKAHVPLAKRPVEASLEERLEAHSSKNSKMKKRRKL